MWAMHWHVTIRTRTAKQIQRLPARVRQSLDLLLAELAGRGPVRGNWPNYSKLRDDRHHCHIKKGRPTYVAVWVVTDAHAQQIEVTYVGTHANAPY